MAHLSPEILDEEAPGGMVINPHSALGKELRKWEQHRTEFVGKGTNPGNPYVYREYPRMLYKAAKRPNGQVRCMEVQPEIHTFMDMAMYQRAVNEVESWNRARTVIVGDESEHRSQKNNGWQDTPALAVAHFEAMEQDIAQAAAEAAFRVRVMTSKAQQELKTADAETHEHVVDVTGGKKGAKPVTAQA